MSNINENTAWSNAPGLEAAMKRDRAFFKRHPFLTEYVRELMPDEFPPSAIPVPPGCEVEGVVKVTRITSNVRIRAVENLIVFAKREV